MGLLRDVKPRSVIGRAVRRLVAALARDRGAEVAKIHEFARRFPAYSPRNALLIALQRPGAVLVRGRKAWEGLGHRVRKGAQSIGVFAPALEPGDTRATLGFTRREVYDAADLEGPPPALPALLPPDDPGARAQTLVAGLESWIRGSGLSLVEGSPRPNTHCWGATNGIAVWVLPHLEGAARAAVLAHEIAHVRLHYRRGRGTVVRIDDGLESSRSREELQAELTAFLLLALHGIDASQGAADYLASWKADAHAIEEEFPVAFDAAMGVAGQIKRRRFRVYEASRRRGTSAPAPLGALDRPSVRHAPERAAALCSVGG